MLNDDVLSGIDNKKKTKASANKKRGKKDAKKKKYKQVSYGVVHVRATNNNTMISITEWANGNILTSSSAPKCGFKGARKSTPYAAQVAATDACSNAINNNAMKQVVVVVKGPGAGRDSSVRAIGNSGLKIVAIIDKTGIPYNGCRGKKRRKV